MSGAAPRPPAWRSRLCSRRGLRPQPTTAAGWWALRDSNRCALLSHLQPLPCTADPHLLASARSAHLHKLPPCHCADRT
eukprot:2068999-Prymnesium_polylepis.2